LSGLPTGTQTTEPNLSTLQQLGLSAKDAGDFVKWLQDNILNKPATTSGTTTTPTTQPAATSGTTVTG
jgi:phospholipase/lecithinase/hemolysin